MLPPMRYKSFTFPHNPRIYSITFSRDTAVLPVPMGHALVQDLGRRPRILRGEGEFFGPEAYDTFKALACVFCEEGPGMLWHPVWQMSRAYFTGLSLRQEPRRDYVAYRLEFQEGYFGFRPMETLSGGQTSSAADPAQRRGGKKSVTVVPGDTLWAIARRNGLTLAGLLALNPGIANPNLIRAGERVMLS